MSRDLLDTLLLRARRRQAAIALALVAPWTLVALAFAWRAQGGSWLLPVATAVVALAAAWRAQGLLDPHWTVRRLDARYPPLEDSTALLLDAPTTLPALARWQRDRVAQRLQALRPAPDLRPAWPRGAIGASTAAALLVAALVLLWPARAPGGPVIATPPTAAAAPDPSIRLAGQSILVQPPAYTGLPTRTEPGLRARVPEGARLRWTLRYSGAPRRVELVFHDGQRLALAEAEGAWSASRTLARSTLYRIEVEGEGAPSDRTLHRIDVIPDRAPTIRVLAPDRSLSLMEPGQKRWALAFEASDDHGLGAAQLRITLAQGSGENITVSARTLALAGSGDARRRTYRRALDLAGLGFAAGDDLVVRLSVSDRRSPAAQTTRSASFILRWPPDAGAEATGVEGLVKRTLPAYFRSQRQIIIDSEALLAQRRKLKADAFLQRSDEIGVDQRILRLRYGQFLGEEAVSGVAAPPTGDGDKDHEDGEHAETPAAAPATGDATSMLEAYGHTHDESEAATLLDKDTRALLKSALDEMWQSELHLRQGDPRQALPYQNRALRLIKQVQQASRIYLARVGLELPPIDEARRMGGDRAGIQPASTPVSRATTTASPALDLWQQLGGSDAAATRAAAERFEAWLRANEAQVDDALDLFAALDAWRGERDCRDCARRLRARLWPLLPATVPGIAPRREPDARGRAYLDALRAGDAP